MDIAVEAGELMEHFLWLKDNQVYEVLEKNRLEVENELADVVFVAICAPQIGRLDDHDRRGRG